MSVIYSHIHVMCHIGFEVCNFKAYEPNRNAIINDKNAIKSIIWGTINRHLNCPIVTALRQCVPVNEREKEKHESDERIKIKRWISTTWSWTVTACFWLNVIQSLMCSSALLFFQVYLKVFLKTSLFSL